VKHGSLFSGIGGFDLAAQWMGWENVFHCEWNDFGQKVLQYYWPKAISYHDITKTDFTIHRGQIDILTGGFPCQPYSAAGKRLGKEDERHLWPEMLRAIREIQPTWVVGENVLGLVNWNGGLVFHEVQTDLEAQGYEVQPYVLPAVSINAPHRRDRVWFVAYSKLYANGLRTERGMDLGGQLLERPKRKEKTNGLNNISKNERVTPNTNSNRNTQETRSDSGIERQESPIDEQGVRGQQQTGGDIGHDGLLRDASDTTSQGSRQQPSEDRGWQNRRSDNDGEVQYATDTDCIGLREQGDGTGESRFFSKDGKGNNWSNFPTQSPICDGNDGLSSRLDGITFPKWRNESIKAGGNAVVPQVVHQIFKAIQEYDQRTDKG